MTAATRAVVVHVPAGVSSSGLDILVAEFDGNIEVNVRPLHSREGWVPLAHFDGTFDVRAAQS